jgi:endonuclease/exonuclease/phosphatase family metal-dependent hydrolase
MKIVLAILLLFAQVNSLHSQEFRVMFYNVENFFDTENDPDTNDDAFTPTGANHWNKHRFIQKRNNIYKTIIAANKGHIPHIIGLCEVENRYVLRHLTEYTPLSKYNYGIVHYDSPDRRGIDVALLYLKDSFEIITSYTCKTPLKTRDILYVKGKTNDNDTLHFFVNHFPSKWGGAESEVSRILVAKILKNAVDSIFNDNRNANICVMGDFNDYPDSKSIKVMDTKPLHTNVGNAYLYNMSLHLQDDKQGSIKFQNRWELIDLFFVSGNLLFNETGLTCSANSIEIFKADFLLETVNGEGETPKRTYRGPVYVGGFSDHLPIILVFSKHATSK